MSDFWWNLLPQYWHGYGLVSECMRRWVDNVEDLLNVLPHCLHSNILSLLWMACRCCDRLTSCPNDLLQSSQANGLLVPVCDRLACTSRPWAVLNILSHLMQEYVSLPKGIRNGVPDAKSPPNERSLSLIGIRVDGSNLRNGKCPAAIGCVVIGVGRYVDDANLGLGMGSVVGDDGDDVGDVDDDGDDVIIG